MLLKDLCWLLLVARAAAIVYVSPGGTDGSGTLSDPFNSVASALADGDAHIGLLSGTFSQSVAISGRTVTIASVAGQQPVFDGGGQNAIFVVSGGATVSLSGLALVNGHADLGGAVQINGATVAVERCQVSLRPSVSAPLSYICLCRSRSLSVAFSAVCLYL